MSWREIAQAVFERSGRSADDVSGTTTEAYAEGVLAQGNPFAPRPLNSAMSLEKIRATGFEPEDALAALDRYLAAERSAAGGHLAPARGVRRRGRPARRS